jgi:ectoine hydroxylase-related dioxygenase (phytanoyl-CoA dioxygenase family)
VPGSHRWEPERRAGDDEAVTAEMPEGSVLFYRGSLIHGGGANRADRPRLGVILEFVVSWLRAQETNLLAVPPDVVAGLPERLQELLGYNIFPPFLGYVDGRHPRRTLARATERG